MSVFITCKTAVCCLSKNIIVQDSTLYCNVGLCIADLQDIDHEGNKIRKVNFWHTQINLNRSGSAD